MRTTRPRRRATTGVAAWPLRRLSVVADVYFAGVAFK
jgi:hypothetical protein